MFLYFDSQGVLREIVQDELVRQGDVNSKRIYVYLEGDPIIDDLWCIVKKPDGTVTNEVSIKDNVAYMEIPYSKNRDLKYFEDYYEYHFYYYELPPMVESGLATATFRAKINESLVAQGIVTFNVEANVIKYDHEITQSQYDYLISYVSAFKSNIDKKLDANGFVTSYDGITRKLNSGVVGVITTRNSDINLGNTNSKITLEGSTIRPFYLTKELALYEDITNAININNNGFVTDKFNEANELTDTKLLDYILISTKGQNNGVASLDSNGKIPSSQLPSAVDEIIEGTLTSSVLFTSTDGTIYTGDSAVGKIFIDLGTNKSYRWSGTQFSVIGSDLALGETNGTAYEGSKGKLNRENITKNKEEIDSIKRDVTNNRIGLLKVSDYDEDTGIITFTYDENLVKALNYNETTGILTITYEGVN